LRVEELAVIFVNAYLLTRVKDQTLIQLTNISWVLAFTVDENLVFRTVRTVLPELKRMALPRKFYVDVIGSAFATHFLWIPHRQRRAAITHRPTAYYVDIFTLSALRTSSPTLVRDCATLATASFTLGKVLVRAESPANARFVNEVLVTWKAVAVHVDEVVQFAIDTGLR
jgi:hypothetical protein